MTGKPTKSNKSAQVPETRARSRRRIREEDIGFKTPSGAIIQQSWCRRCSKMKDVESFNKAVDPILDTNGLMSICVECINELFDQFLLVETNYDRAILKMCRLINVKFSESAVVTANKIIAKFDNEGKAVTSKFGVYKSAMAKEGKVYGIEKAVGSLTFSEPPLVVIDRITPDQVGVTDDLESFWGKGLTLDQYEFLEREFGRYKKTHKCDTAAEESLLRLICFSELDIREKRLAGQSPDSSVKMLQDLMKTASVDPAKTAIAGSIGNRDTFSAFIKTIEDTEPAEYFADKELFKDWDDIGKYFRQYVTRPIKNFIIGSRDFDLDAVDDFEEEDGGTDVESVIDGVLSSLDDIDTADGGT